MQPINSITTARQMAIEAIHRLQKENEPRISDTQWTSYSGYNYGRWADKGFNVVLRTLSEMPGQTGEMGPAYLRRICDQLRQVGDEYRDHAADEDGACSGAIDAAIWAIMGLLPPAEPERHVAVKSWHDPLPDVEWKLWYTDLFDRESPPSVDLQGQGLAEGLKELWQRFLFEEVSPGGGLGLSRFHIWSQERTILVEGEWAGVAQLRHWLYGAQARSRRELASGGERLLEKIGVVHAQHIRDGGSSEPIVAAALAAGNLAAFEAAIDQMNRP